MNTPQNSDKRSRLLSRISELIDCMTSPVSSQEKNDGWSEEAKTGMAGYWTTLHDHIANGQLTAVDLTTPPGRGMSFWGIEQGEVFTRGNAVFSEIRWLVEEGYLLLDQ